MRSTLPFLVIALAALAIAAIVYSTTRPGTPYVPQRAPPASPQEQQEAAAQLAALKCPEDYANDDERDQAYIDFVNDFFTANPTASGTYDFEAGRIDFLISHHCTQTLMAFGYDGTSTITAQVRASLIENALQSASDTTSD